VQRRSRKKRTQKTRELDVSRKLSGMLMIDV